MRLHYSVTEGYLLLLTSTCRTAIEQSWRIRVFGLGTEIQALHTIFWIKAEREESLKK